MTTKIEWCQETWNPVTGCTPISEGCTHCYAQRMAKRLAGRYGYPADYPFKVTFHPDRLEDPLKWRKPRQIFVCSMGDLFHDDVSFYDIEKVFNTINDCDPQRNGGVDHRFLILTKRPKRMKSFFEMSDNDWRIALNPSIWLGVTAENQKRADERIPILLQIPAAVRFVSVEPMLGPVDLRNYLFHEDCDHYDCDENCMVGINPPYAGLIWTICGGESGPGARPMHPDWARLLRDQCVAAGVPFFFKQWGQWEPVSPVHGGTEEEENRWADEYGRRESLEPNGYFSDEGFQPGPKAYLVENVGKKKAGRLLDGRTWDEYPT